MAPLNSIKSQIARLQRERPSNLVPTTILSWMSWIQPALWAAFWIWGIHSPEFRIANIIFIACSQYGKLLEDKQRKLREREDAEKEVNDSIQSDYIQDLVDLQQ